MISACVVRFGAVMPLTVAVCASMKLASAHGDLCEPSVIIRTCSRM